MSSPAFTPAAALDDIAEGSPVKVDLLGTEILLCRANGTVFAVANRCSHAHELLECGQMRAGWIACPAHGARFDLETGKALNPPATEPITTYATRIVDGVVEVML